MRDYSKASVIFSVSHPFTQEVLAFVLLFNIYYNICIVLKWLNSDLLICQ